MNIKKVSNNALSWLLQGFKLVKVSPFTAPVAVILVGILIHAGFSVAPAGKVIFGGPVEVAQAHMGSQIAMVAAESSGIGSDELDIASEPRTLPVDSVSASSVFDAGTAPAAIPGVRLHAVRPGETLYSIANQYGIDQKALAKANKIMGDTLIVGDDLVIPSSAAITEVKGNPNAHLTVQTYLPKGYIWPVTGPFSDRHGPYNAYDIPTPVGTPVKASGPGVVSSADYGYNGGYGVRVIIDHVVNGVSVQTTYNHLSDILVFPGQHVERGDVIGLSGSTGHSTGPHVHFEVRW